MDSKGFSNGFDVMLNSHAARALFGEQAAQGDLILNEYEKSLLLTESQEDIILELYNGKGSATDGFETTEELRRYLSPLVEDEVITNSIKNTSGHAIGINTDSSFFTLPNDVWFITYEAVKAKDNTCGESVLDVFPTRQDEYHKIRRNPFRGANDRRALRLDLSDGVVEIVCNKEIVNYYVRYLKRPRPIILADLDGLDIEGYTWGGYVTPDTPETKKVYGDKVCILPDSLHQRVLEGAVLKALQTRGVNNKQDNN